MKTERYSTVAIVLHWAIALLIIGMLIFGEDMVSNHHGATDFSRSLHATIGMAILALTFMRLGWRLVKTPPALPQSMKSWERKASKAAHHLFYVLLIAIPLTGWLSASAISNEHGTAFFIAGLPMIVMPLPDLGEFYEAMHGLSGNLMWALLALHVAGALKHQFLDGHKAYMARMGIGRSQ